MKKKTLDHIMMLKKKYSDRKLGSHVVVLIYYIVVTV